jgi:hypothetical protein
LGVVALAVDQADREGVHRVYPGATTFQLKSCSLFSAWHQRLLIFGENEYRHSVLLFVTMPLRALVTRLLPLRARAVSLREC